MNTCSFCGNRSGGMHCLQKPSDVVNHIRDSALYSAAQPSVDGRCDHARHMRFLSSACHRTLSCHPLLEEDVQRARAAPERYCHSATRDNKRSVCGVLCVLPRSCPTTTTYLMIGHVSSGNFRHGFLPPSREQSHQYFGPPTRCDTRGGSPAQAPHWHRTSGSPAAPGRPVWTRLSGAPTWRGRTHSNDGVTDAYPPMAGQLWWSGQRRLSG